MPVRRLSLRTKFLLYLLALHIPFGAIAYDVFSQNRPWLLAVEVAFGLSFVTSLVLLRSLFGPLQLLRTGASFLKERDFHVRLAPTGQPELDPVVELYNNMLDHLRDERIRLEEKQYFLDRILDASPSGILTFDFDGRISLANPRAAAMLQRPPQELTGKRLGELATPFATALAKTLAAPPSGRSEVLPLHGSRRVRCQRSEFLDRGFARPFLVMEELTEELRQSEKAAYEKLIRMMSHEVNNSLGAARSLLESCLRYKPQLRIEDQRDFEEALSVVISRADRLSNFMNEFADVVRLPPPRLVSADIRPVLQGLVTLMRNEAEKRRIELREEHGEPPAQVPMDKRQMEHAFVNVIKNALEAIGKDGTVTIRTGRRAGYSFAEIEDTGPGIAPEARDNLFRPFFSTKENGQGLGLTIAQEILTSHGFGFALEGQPGGGARFTVTWGG